jgi:lipopolysaccharide transport system ATP-binding protein
MKPIISVRNVGKQYRIGVREAAYATVRESLMRALRAPLQWRRPSPTLSEDTVWALENITFDVSPGEVVGVIGRNGAGKSTLLKILARVTEPTIGAVDLYARVGSLLEVGTGFHPELTGRENVYLNGAILGMSRKEIRHKYDAIVAFSEMERFIETPVKRYSSGMQMRLAFAVAAHLETEILLLDEVLAVGDADFQKKCLGKISEVAHEGRTVLFVTHQMSAVKALCSRAVLLDKGWVVRDGSVKAVVNYYLEEGLDALLPERVWLDPQRRPGDALLRLCAIRAVDRSGELRSTYPSSGEIVVELEFELSTVNRRLCIGFALLNRDGVTVFQSCHTDGYEKSWPPLQVGCNRLRCTIPAGLLSYGKYYLAPRAYLHSLDWVLNGDPEVAFDIQLDHGVSPMWASIIPSHFPGVIAPCLNWEGGLAKRTDRSAASSS